MDSGSAAHRFALRGIRGTQTNEGREQSRPFSIMFPSSSAEADDPVFRAFWIYLWRQRLLDARIRGHDDTRHHPESLPCA
jgi:hypothetical protein